MISLFFSPTLEKHIEDVVSVFKLMEKNRLFVKLKVQRFNEEFSFLRHKISANGISVEQDKVKAIRDCPTPSCVRDIQSFNGTCSYYRRFIKNFAKISLPLTDLLREDVSFIWSQEQEKAFNKLKHVLSHAPILKTSEYSTYHKH